MSTTRIKIILRKVNEQVQDLLNVDRFYVVLYDEATAQLEFPFVKNKNEESASSWATRDFLGSDILPDRIIAQQKELVFGPNIKEKLREDGTTYWPGKNLPLAWLGMPMIGVEKQTIGALIVENKDHSNIFGDDDIEALKVISHGIARVIENAWLDNRLKRKMANLRAINAVGQHLTLNIQLDEQGILELIYQHAGSVMDTNNMYIALFDATQKQLRFPLVVDEKKRIEDQISTRLVELDDETQGGLTEIVLRKQKHLLIPDVPAWCKEKNIVLPHDNVQPISWLGIPIMQKDNILGIIALWNSKHKNVYDPDDLETLQVMSSQAAIAIANTRLYHDIDQLYHDTNQRLAALIEISSNIRLHQDETLDLVYEQARLLMDTSKIYIALYDAKTQILSFPLNIRETSEGKIHRVQEPSRKAILADETQGGLTEIVLRTQKALRISNVAVWCQEKNFNLPLLPIPKSWMGVPMMRGNNILGIIALWNDDFENVYEPKDEDVLQAMANQATVALENAKLYKNLESANKQIVKNQEEILAAEQLNLINQMGAEFAHRMNNLASAIPVRVNMAKDHLDINNPQYNPVIKQLDAIDSHTRQLLDAAQEIRRTGEIREKEPVIINELLQLSIDRVWNIAPEIKERINVKKHMASDLPIIKIERNRLLDVLENIVRNGVEAIAEKGTLTVTTYKSSKDSKPYIEITIADTGKGIPTQDLSKVFELFYTTKTETGMGFALAGARLFLKGLGGNIQVDSPEGQGSIFTITVPVDTEIV